MPRRRPLATALLVTAVALAVAAMHYDPGPYWDWDWDWARYFGLLGAPLPAPRGSTTPVLTLTPRFDTNVEPRQSCDGDTCTDLAPQGSNVVISLLLPSSATGLSRADLAAPVSNSAH